MTLGEVSDGVHADPAFDPRGVDALALDCDGVLVDVSGSYDAAIDATARRVLGAHGIAPARVGPAAIEAFKATGGFNDEVDLACAAVLSIAAASRAGRDPAGFLAEVARESGRGGIGAVEEYVRGVADVSDLAARMSHPGPGRRSPLYDEFDQVFYGSELYREIFGREAGIRGPGLIGRDRVILTGGLAAELAGRFGRRMALVTGRGLRSARHSLGGLLDSFDLRSSAFLEDEPRGLAKPDPRPLLAAVAGMGGGHALYVGDSMEDLVMARRASEAGARVSFCGITGTCSDPRAKLGMFGRGGAALALDSVLRLPGALNLEQGRGGGRAWAGRPA